MILFSDDPIFKPRIFIEIKLDDVTGTVVFKVFNLQEDSFSQDFLFAQFIDLQD